MKKYSYSFLLNNSVDLNKHSYMRNIVIIPLMVGKEFEILNGKKKIKVFINKDMLGLRLGEFIFNRSIGNVHNKDKNKKKMNTKKK